jgi:hypothetical protein
VENQKMLKELRLNTLASEITTYLPQPAQKKGKNQQTRELITKIDQGDNTDADDIESNEQPQLEVLLLSSQ